MNKILSLIAMAILGFTVQVDAQVLKQSNITSISNSLATITKLEPINFSYDKNWADKLSLKPTQSGFNIQELIKINPQLIVNQQLNYSAGKNNTKTAVVQKVDYEMLIPLLVGSIKEQQQQINVLKAEIDALKSKGVK